MATNEVRLHGINWQGYDINDGAAKMLGLVTLDLPEMQSKTVTVNGIGIAGDYDSIVKSHFEPLAATLHWRVLNNDSMRYLRQKDAFNFRFYQAQQYFDAGSGNLRVPSLVVVMRCFCKNLKLGKFEPSEQGEVEMEVTIDYLKITHDGNTHVEFDIFNFIYNVNGVDFMEEIRDALGL